MRKQTKQKNTQTWNRQVSKTTEHKQKYRISSPGPDHKHTHIYIYIHTHTYHVFIRGGSWAGYPVVLFCFMFSLEVFLFHVCCVYVCLFVLFSLCLCFRLVLLSFCIYNRTTHIKQNKQKQTRRSHKQQTQKTHKYIISQPEPEKYSFAVGSWAGFYVMFCMFCMFSPSLVKLLHLQSNTT